MMKNQVVRSEATRGCATQRQRGEMMRRNVGKLLFCHRLNLIFLIWLYVGLHKARVFLFRQLLYGGS